MKNVMNDEKTVIENIAMLSAILKKSEQDDMDKELFTKISGFAHLYIDEQINRYKKGTTK